MMERFPLNNCVTCKKIILNLQEITKDVESVVTGIEWLVLEKSILTNV